MRLSQINEKVASGEWRQLMEGHGALGVLTQWLDRVFGASGLLLGPLAVTATVFFLEIWRVRVTPREPMT